MSGWPFVHDEVRGIADFLERVDLPDGALVYEPVASTVAGIAERDG